MSGRRNQKNIEEEEAEDYDGKGANPRNPSSLSADVRGSFYQPDNNQVEEYKQKLIRIGVGIGLVIFLLIAERIFYEIVIDAEVDLLHDVQVSFGLSSEVTLSANGTDVDAWQFSDAGIWQFLGKMDKFKYNFLLLTGVVGACFVSFDSFIAVKVGYMTIYAYYLITCISIMYSGARPFWESSEIATPVCLNSFSHPSRSTFLLLFIVFYSIFCLRRRLVNSPDNNDNDSSNVNNNNENSSSVNSKFYTILTVTSGVMCTGIIFLKYLMGLDFIVNIILAAIYFGIYYSVLIFLDEYVDELMQKSTVLEKPAKKYVFYWFLYLMLSLTFVTVLYSSQDYYEPIDWIKNFVQCATINQSMTTDLPYDEILGPWFTFVQASCLFGLIGAVFGAAYTYRNISKKNFNWFKGPLAHRLLRVGILIICLGPSIVLTYFQEDLVNMDWMRQIGMNEFFLSSLHYFFLYIFLLGVYPTILLKINLIEISDDDGGYNVLQAQHSASQVSHNSNHEHNHPTIQKTESDFN